MNTPKELRYAKSHEWVQFLNEDNTTARIGLTDYAQNALGDLVFVNLPQEGDPVVIGESFGDVESVKAVSDMFSPVTGTVSAVNEALLDDPASINNDCYNAWFIEVSNISETEDLLEAHDYETHCQEEA